MALFSKYCSQSTVSKVRQSMSGFWPAHIGFAGTKKGLAIDDFDGLDPHAAVFD